MAENMDDICGNFESACCVNYNHDLINTNFFTDVQILMPWQTCWMKKTMYFNHLLQLLLLFLNHK